MTTEELLALGITQEQADAIFGMNGRDITALRGQITTLTTQNTQLQADSIELASLRQQNMTAEQLQQQAVDQANLEKEKYIKMQNSLKAREALITGGLTPDEIDDDLLALMVAETEDATEKRCKAYTEKITSKLVAKEKELNEKLLKNTTDPAKPEGSDDNDVETEAVKKAREVAKTLGNTQVDLSAFN